MKKETKTMNKNKKLLVLSVVPMLLLTSCDKEITKEEATTKAANIQTAQKTTTYNSYKTKIETSMNLADGRSMEYKLEYAFDLANTFAYVEYTSNTKKADGSKTKATYGAYCYADSKEGFVEAYDDNGEKYYAVTTVQPSQYENAIKSIAGVFSNKVDQLEDLAVDAEDILEDIADNDDLDGSMNSVFSGFGAAVSFGSSYSVKYFTTSSTSFGVSINVSNSASWTNTAISVSGESRIEWKDNLLSNVSTKAKLAVNDNEYNLNYSQSKKYNGKYTKNINLKNYEKASA